ncbi:class I SAM-dependent methyltransferase [Paenibacillus gorillae]|uniref:class I SAM-dependent methyltransferase n=1 Tax=Paenibacillus gorillae TaxID=1243662 RepID=UPI0004B64101|nr:class I SAM-dependent methyltransferase [Paenibacillus gorillae]
MDEEIDQMERMYATSFDDVMLDHHYRYHYASRFIREGDFVLDAACGSGYGTHYMAEHSPCSIAVGVDRSEHALDWAVNYFSHAKTVYLNSDLTGSFRDDLPIHWFDVITCFETVEHLKEDQAFIKKLYDSLTANGILLISAPNENVIPYLENPYYLNGVNPYHYRHYRPNELKRLLLNCGFRIQQVLTQDNDTYELIPGRIDGFSTVLVAIK